MTNLLPPASDLGSPLPFPLLVALKVLGFTLHEGPMNLWYAGAPVAILLALFGSANGKQLARRLAMALPIALALGINFGIVPLLFTQVGYSQFFYPAGILIAWPWLCVIPLLLVAYYGVYLYARSSRPRLALFSGVVGAGCLVLIGFLFANNFSLMTNVAQWQTLFAHTAVAGAPTGVALNIGDPTLFPRWLMMFGIALTTTAAYLVFDAAFFARRETEEYRAWAGRFAPRLYLLGLVWAGAMAVWYLGFALSKHVQETALARPGILALGGATALAPVVVAGLVWLWRRSHAPVLAGVVAAGQFAFLGVNAASRQWVQNVELRPAADLAAIPVHPQWGAFVAFAATLVLALVIAVWMVAKLKRAWWQEPEGMTLARRPAESTRKSDDCGSYRRVLNRCASGIKVIANTNHKQKVAPPNTAACSHNRASGRTPVRPKKGDRSAKIIALRVGPRRNKAAFHSLRHTTRGGPATMGMDTNAG